MQIMQVYTPIDSSLSALTNFFCIRFDRMNILAAKN